jgi:acyl carrier protein
MVSNRNEVFEHIREIFVELLDNESLIISESSTRNDIDGWDSLIHLHLVVEMGKHFKVKFTALESQNWKNVGEIIDSILSKNN